MQTTQEHTGGGQMEAPDIVHPLARLFLASRKLSLPHAANGEPKAPSDPRVAQIRKDMAQGRSQEFRRIRDVALGDRKDGVPAALITAPLRQLIAEIEMTEPETRRLRMERPLCALVRAEKKIEHRLDLAELRAVESPTSVEAMADVIREASLVRAALDDLTTGLEGKLVVVRAQEREVIGARRHGISTPSMQVML